MENILKNIESNYPVDQILVNGEQVWPYLRIHYFIRYLNEITASVDEEHFNVNSLSSRRPIRILQVLMQMLRGIPYGFGNWFGRYEYIALTSNSYRRQVAGQYINRFLDPLIDELGPDRVLCMEDTSPFPAYPVDWIYTRHMVSTSLLWLLMQLIVKLRKVLRIRYKIVNKRVLDMIDADYGLNVDAAAQIENYAATRKAFTYLFRLLRPKAVLLTCYYGREPVVKAAKSLGIKVIEVQHGLIGKEHMAYNVYCDIDRSCFPDHLLVFGEQELTTFDNLRFIDPANVHPVGSFYIDYVKATYRPEPQLSERFVGFKRVVGVTLQWTNEKRVLSFICEAAKLDGSIFYILIPRWPQNPAYSTLEPPPNVEVIRDKNFYELMAYTDFHSTVNSTCALEAPALGVQNILVDIDGEAKAYYGMVLCDSRVTRFADTPEEYVAIVNSFPRLDREVVCNLHEDFFAPNYQENIRNFVRTYLS